jgi:GntR family transcriptional regulator
MRVDPAYPVFEQIADAIRAAITAGVYRPGEAVPSIRVQATKLLINPNTIKHAYDQLEREGLIESRPGLGMFVTPRAAEVAREGVEQTVRNGLTRHVQHARSAGLPRPRVDEMYRKAWGRITEGSSP